MGVIIIKINGFGIGKLRISAMKLQTKNISFLFFWVFSVCSCLADDVDLKRFGSQLVAAIKENDKKMFVELIAPQESLLALRAPKTSRNDERMRARVFEDLKREIIADIQILSSKESGFGRYKTVRFLSAKLIVSGKGEVLGSNIKIEYGGDEGTGICYIVVGKLLQEGGRYYLANRFLSLKSSVDQS